jgi:hypothetical protein
MPVCEFSSTTFALLTYEKVRITFSANFLKDMLSGNTLNIIKMERHMRRSTKASMRQVGMRDKMPTCMAILKDERNVIEVRLISFLISYGWRAMQRVTT